MEGEQYGFQAVLLLHLVVLVRHSKDLLHNGLLGRPNLLGGLLAGAGVFFADGAGLLLGASSTVQVQGLLGESLLCSFLDSSLDGGDFLGASSLLGRMSFWRHGCDVRSLCWSEGDCDLQISFGNGLCYCISSLFSYHIS